MTPAERHNGITGEVVKAIVGPVAKAGGGYGEVMVIVESVILGVMLANRELYGMADATPPALVESAVQAAIERYTVQIAGGR